MSSMLHGLRQEAGVLQAFILEPLLFLLYINDLADGLFFNAKHFPDDTFLFCAMHDPVITTSELNNNHVKIKQWAFEKKMSFNLDLNNQAQEVIFSRKLKKVYHPTLHFSNSNCIKPQDCYGYYKIFYQDQQFLQCINVSYNLI